MAEKRTQGGTAREIGNAILRSTLAKPTLSGLVERKLLEAGILNAEQLARIRREAAEELRGREESLASTLVITPEGTFRSGSWEARLIHSSREGGYQVFEGWALDELQRPTEFHVHPRSHHYWIVIAGRVLLVLDGEEHLLRAGDFFHVPPGMVHNDAPLDLDTRVLTINMPPEPGLETLGSTR